jgi:hypothetical protein
LTERWRGAKKNLEGIQPQAMSRDRLNQIDWAQEYENVRREALLAGGTGRRGHGLALFLSAGMRAWLEALTALRPRPVASSEMSRHERIELPPAARPDLTALLADMVLACIEKEAHGHIQ